ncbi:adhesion G-protein coupled receptor G2 [Neolamprologus brichardi]|uniref:adhesion G-protein coupled receptor G2 n=1 Tax=Neolamprologus brichardi TaxID=32507 RepID=UPI0003EC11AF|nr:adhesion G-protein coupled receptor G2 [Neolamprologus brichardi]
MNSSTATTPGNNYTAMYNASTGDINYTVVHNAITSGNNFNVTATNNNYTIVYNATGSGSNYTLVYAATTADNNYTAMYNVTTAGTTLHNGVVTTSKTTVSTTTIYPNYTMIKSTTTASNNYTTPVIITPTILSQNKTTAIIGTTEKSRTAAVSHSTKPTSAPLKNQTANFTTVSLTHVTTISKNETMSTTAASTVQTDDRPDAGLTTTTTTTTENASVVIISPATTATTITGHGPQDLNGTTAEVSLTTTPLTKTTTTTIVAENTGTSTTDVQTTDEAVYLLNQTQDVSLLNASQVSVLVETLEKHLDNPSVSRSVIIKVVSNLMDSNPEALSKSANRLIHLVDNLGVKLAVTGGDGILSTSSLVVAVKRVNGSNFTTILFDVFNTDHVQFSGPKRTMKSSEPALASVYLPASLTSGISPEEQKQANSVQFTFYAKNSFFKDASLDNKTLVSTVLGSSVANLSISNLSENIEFAIRNSNPVHKNYTAKCAFWDFTLNSGGGGWSSVGCFVVNSTPEYTICSCSHLTSFAVLLDLSRQELPDQKNTQILTFITYIGCGISAIFLAITLLTYLSFPKLLRDIPAKILVQLCSSLLFLNLVFLLDSWLGSHNNTGLCICTAFFLHYFLLTSFTWAGLEALHMYLSIVRVFTPYLSQYMLKFTLMGWGIPLIIVIIVISVDKNNYGLINYGKHTNDTSDNFCWLSNNIAFYVGVVAYFLLIFILCLLAFIVVMGHLSRIKKQNPHNQSPKRSVMTDLRSVTGLVIILGLTWGFALFAWGPLYLPFVYLFSIFNSLQGFFVFVFHCAIKENVRRQWRTYLCCGKLRLAENSDWSRTFTQNKKTISRSSAITLDPKFTSRSSSVVSFGTNSSGSVFADSGISDSSNNDVVLNEIHRGNLTQGKTTK